MWYSSCPLHSWYLFHDEEVNLDALTGSFQTRLPECHGLIGPFIHWVATTLGARAPSKRQDLCSSSNSTGATSFSWGVIPALKSE